MAWKTFTLLPLLLAATLANPMGSTTELSTPPALSSEQTHAHAQTQIIKEEHFPAMAPPQAIESSGSSGQPIALQPPLPSSSGDEDALRRRTVTYDQRQEGQYNIRADLENFMILLIPPGPQEGISLLELLGRGNTKGPGALKRKHPLRSNSLKSFYQKSHLQKLQQQQQQQQNHHQSSPALPLPEFIEGRSPYHVDISASDPEQAQRLQRQQVDVLPPQLIPMPQLIKPYHLEAEPELIQALPPVSASSSSGSNLLESYNHPGSQYFRSSRALRGDSYLDTNRLTGGDFASPRSISAPIYRSDLGGVANGQYPPIDAPTYFADQSRSWQLDEEPTRAQALEPEIVSFDLLADDDLAESRTLLRDGLARCARGERRDSYGACRQIEGY
ncbi:uncharacterized protein LOC128263380 [Drosophila gunungcola]|uniref:Uncharacterized protein n=1 Tax=Drosophila gunungcola TaxID=103775 RepID=A0A9P9YS25_9MUSC|nr:uncharacterized protein LOC128263380 [Drosophila gunungcola]KAI8041863.1 hypothetical protein M5D96_003158 [Drosophila gunungcola]